MDIQSILQEVGNWTSDDAVERGVLTIGGAIVASAFAVYRWLRGKPTQRSRVVIDCEPGEKVLVQLGEAEKPALFKGMSTARYAPTVRLDLGGDDK